MPAKFVHNWAEISGGGMPPDRVEELVDVFTDGAMCLAVRCKPIPAEQFSIERAEEIYRPNNTESDAATIRSQQTLEATSTGSRIDGGIPGALTNRPPEPAVAPIEAGGKKTNEENAEGEEAANKTPPLPTDKKKESTINYEVDKTVQHTQQSTGNIKRLTAAVVVNYRKKIDESGEVTHEPLTADEIKEINNLVKEAMGYSEKRGDSLTVTNNLFTAESETILDAEFWKNPDILMLAKDIGKQLLIATIVLFFLLKILRPFLKSLAPPPIPALPEKAPGETALAQLSGQMDRTAIQAVQKSIFEENLKKAKQLAVDEPAIVANVVKDWVSKNG